MSADEVTLSTGTLDKLLSAQSVVVSDVAGSSARGTRRSRNEDAWGFRGGGAFVVADGMGGRPGGDVAALASVESFLEQLCSDSIDWRALFDTVNRSVSRSAESHGLSDVGAVAIGMRCSGDRITLAHVGDARAYRLRDSQVQQLTRDHSIAEAIATLGVRRSASGLPTRQLAAVTSFFGGTHSAEEFSVHELTPRSGDRIVLCSDGVYRFVETSDWMWAASAPSAHGAAEGLVARARSNGSTDDCTALVIDVDVDITAPTDWTVS